MPITVGSQTNVPDTGDPITSPWPQDTAGKLVHRFASTTARDAWTTRPDGAMCVTTDTDTVWVWNGTEWVAQTSSSVLAAMDSRINNSFRTSIANVTTDANGYAIINYAGGGFAAGPIYVAITPASTTVYDQIFILYDVSSPTLFSFRAMHANTNTPVVSTAVTAIYIAFDGSTLT